MALRVLIAGGGLGGLTLAHALRQSGVDVAVFERDRPRPDDLTTSYRILDVCRPGPRPTSPYWVMRSIP